MTTVAAALLTEAFSGDKQPVVVMNADNHKSTTGGRCTTAIGCFYGSQFEMEMGKLTSGRKKSETR